MLVGFFFLALLDDDGRRRTSNVSLSLAKGVGGSGTGDTYVGTRHTHITKFNPDILFLLSVSFPHPLFFLRLVFSLHVFCLFISLLYLLLSRPLLLPPRRHSLSSSSSSSPFP